MPLDRDSADRVRNEAERTDELVVNAARGAAQLWRAQLDIALAMEDEELVREMLRRPSVAWADNNCGCGGGGGTGLW